MKNSLGNTKQCTFIHKMTYKTTHVDVTSEDVKSNVPLNRSFCCKVPASRSVAGYYLALSAVEAVVWLEDADTPTGQAVHSDVARIAQALGLLRPSVCHAAGKLIAGQKLARICLIS